MAFFWQQARGGGGAIGYSSVQALETRIQPGLAQLQGPPPAGQKHVAIIANCGDRCSRTEVFCLLSVDGHG